MYDIDTYKNMYQEHLRKFFSVDGDPNNTQGAKDLRDYRENLLTDMQEKEIYPHPQIAEHVLELEELKIAYPYVSKDKPGKYDDFSMATDTIVGRITNQTYGLRNDDFMEVEVADGKKYLLPYDEVSRICSSNVDEDLRFEPWHDGKFLVSLESEPLRGQGREAVIGDVIDVCITGTPALNSCCGDPLCVCGPEPGPSDAFVEKSETITRALMDKVRDITAQYERDFPEKSHESGR